MSNTQAVTNAQPAIQFRACGCGCGVNVAGKATFRQGHDAKLVSRLANETLRNDIIVVSINGVEYDQRGHDIQNVIDDVAALVEASFGQALSVKYHNAAMNAWAKDAAKSEKAAKRAAAKAARAEGNAASPAVAAWIETEPIKVGRWTYPARTNDREVQRNTKRDGSGEWVAA